VALIIDGHNLIGVMPDIHLADPDDEWRLLERLRAYRARTGQALIVFFDSGDPSTLLRQSSPVPVEDYHSAALVQAGQVLPTRLPDLSSPGIQVRFSTPGQTADDAIVAFLQSRAQPGQYAVVTNDHELAYRARAAGASVISAGDFALRLAHKPTRPPIQPDEPALDPHSPAFADIYAGFIQAEKANARFEDDRSADIDLWLERLYGDDVEQVQRAARWLGQQGGPGVLAALRDALTHNDARVRAAALLALGDLDDPAALPDLCDHLTNDDAGMARTAAAQSLARIGDRTAEPALGAAAKADTKSKVRKAAREALTQIRTRRSKGN
jgi:predicted RNA-binding protein with PIN domain